MSLRNGVLAGALLATLAAGVLHFADAEPVVTFLVAALALAGLAWVISIATEAVGERFGPAITGVLQSTLGNLPELFIVLFALSAGEVVVAKTSIVGSLLANALLVLGLAIVAGAQTSGDGVMRFHRRLPNDTATLLILAVFIIVLLGLSDTVGDRASEHQVAISAIGAVCLLAVYGAWLWGYLRSDRPVEPAMEARPHGTLGFAPAIVLLAVAGVSAALVSDWFVDALDPAVDALGISKAFTGLVIVAIAGNAVENVVGITLAAKGQSDLAISVVKNSVAQIAVFVFPALVLLSLFLEHRLTFVLGPVYIGALLLTALAMWQITGDGEAVAFEGWALVALYVILAVLTWYE
ncbi:MAG: sodium:proton exchanger [Gaiellaceae bacterium]